MLFCWITQIHDYTYIFNVLLRRNRALVRRNPALLWGMHRFLVMKYLSCPQITSFYSRQKSPRFLPNSPKFLYNTGAKHTEALNVYASVYVYIYIYVYFF